MVLKELILELIIWAIKLIIWGALIMIIVLSIAIVCYYFYLPGNKNVVEKTEDYMFLCDSDSDCTTTGSCGAVGINKEYERAWNYAHRRSKRSIYYYSCAGSCLTPVAICESGRCKIVPVGILEIDRVPEEYKSLKEGCLNGKWDSYRNPYRN